MTVYLPRCLPVLLALALGPGGLPALAVQPEGVLLAQAAAGQKPLPAEVEGWADGAVAAHRRGDPAEALRLQQQVVAWLRANRGPVDAELARALSNLGVFLGAVGRRAEALAPTEEAVKLYRDLAKSNPAFLGDLARALNNLGVSYRDLGRRAEALAPTEEAVKLYRDLAKSNPAFLEELARSTTNLANLQIQQGNPGAAIPLLRESMASEALFLQKQLPLMAEERRQALVNTLGSRWEQPFSQAQQGEAGAELALYTRLNRYAPLQDVERRQAALSRSSGAPRQLVDRLTALASPRVV